MTKKEPWGGNRPVAGRHRVDKKERKLAVGFALSPKAIEKLERLAEKLGMSRSGLLERIIQEFKG